MEEHLAACEEHLQLRTKETEKLRQELIAAKKKARQTLISICYVLILCPCYRLQLLKPD